MRVVLTDGTEFSCRNFTATKSGVLLTKDKKRKKVIGFVPNHQLKYVVPDDIEVVDRSADADDVDPLGSTVDEAADESTDETADEPADPTADDLTVGSPTISADELDELDEGDEAENRSEDTDTHLSDESDLRRLGGLGSTYAERLQTAGYETLADLAAADPVAVAEAASVAPGRGRRWVTAAGRAVADEDESEASEGTDEESGDDTADEPSEDDTTDELSEDDTADEPSEDDTDDEEAEA